MLLPPWLPGRAWCSGGRSRLSVLGHHQVLAPNKAVARLTVVGQNPDASGPLGSLGDRDPHVPWLPARWTHLSGHGCHPPSPQWTRGCAGDADAGNPHPQGVRRSASALPSREDTARDLLAQSTAVRPGSCQRHRGRAWHGGGFRATPQRPPAPSLSARYPSTLPTLQRCSLASVQGAPLRLPQVTQPPRPGGGTPSRQRHGQHRCSPGGRWYPSYHHSNTVFHSLLWRKTTSHGNRFQLAWTAPSRLQRTLWKWHTDGTRPRGTRPPAARR